MEFQNIELKSPGEIQNYQWQQLQLVLKYLDAHSPFYKKLFKKAGIEISSIVQLSDLEKIPTTGKEDISQNNFDFLCVKRERVADFTTTSGTTGNPISVALTDNDLSRLAYNEAQSFITAGAKAGDVFQMMLTLDRQFMAGIAYYLGIRKLGATAVRVGPVSPQMQWENILRFAPDTIIAVPSFILKLIEYAHSAGIDLNQCSVKKAICIGEPVRYPNLVPNVLHQRITSSWNIQLYSTYASTEMQTAFTECEHGKGGHFRPELLYVEILNDEGHAVANGEFGEVTITTLGVEGMPLLRYRTGDICCVYTEPCACGRNSLRLSPVMGRKNQMIKYKGTTLFPPSIYDALSKIYEVRDYVVEVFKNELGTDEMVIHIYQSGDLDQMEPIIKAALQSKLRVIPDLNFTSTAHLQSMRKPESRKPAMILFRE